MLRMLKAKRFQRQAWKESGKKNKTEIEKS